MRSSIRPLVLCLVGTDHHPFERLISWSDVLASELPDIDVLVQYGRSRAPKVAEGRDFLAKDELLALLQRAHVAISHGGPGLVSEIRAAGLFPMVVPRDPVQGEHVDGHQLRFVGRLAGSGVVEAVSSEQLFVDTVARRLTQTRDAGVEAGLHKVRVSSSVDRFAKLVEQLLDERR